MIVSLIRILALTGLLLVVAMIETTVAAPFVVVTLFLLQSRSYSTTVFFLFVSCVSLLLASVMLQGWLLLFVVLVTGGIIFRSNIYRVQTSFIASLVLVIGMAVVISMLAAPVISTAYVFHSLLSIFIAAVICYKGFSVKEKKLRWKEISFGGGE